MNLGTYIDYSQTNTKQTFTQKRGKKHYKMHKETSYIIQSNYLMQVFHWLKHERKIQIHKREIEKKSSKFHACDDI